MKINIHSRYVSSVHKSERESDDQGKQSIKEANWSIYILLLNLYQSFKSLKFFNILAIVYNSYHYGR